MRNEAKNRIGRMGAALAVATLVMAWLPLPASAARDPDKVCADVAKKAGKTLWASVRESGDAMFCRKSWVPGTPDEFMGCGTWTLTNKWANKLKGLWNNIFSRKEWATWGARGISVDCIASTALTLIDAPPPPAGPLV